MVFSYTLIGNKYSSYCKSQVLAHQKVIWSGTVVLIAVGFPCPKLMFAILYAHSAIVEGVEICMDEDSGTRASGIIILIRPGTSLGNRDQGSTTWDSRGSHRVKDPG